MPQTSSPLPTLSVITPSLNAGQTIRESITSVLNQNYHSCQYIVIDGGSSDNTMEILKEYEHRIDIVISEPDNGISDAFNKGISRATGEYIAILNADDFYERDAFSSVLSMAEKFSFPDVLHGTLRYIAEPNPAYIEAPDITQIWNYMSVFHPTMFVHRRVYEAVGNYRLDYSYAMDSEWVHRAIIQGIDFVEVPGVVSNMRLGGASYSHMYRSLSEFRKSALIHGGNWSNATYYFVRQLAIQNLLKIGWVKRAALRRKAQEKNF